MPMFWRSASTMLTEPLITAVQAEPGRLRCRRPRAAIAPLPRLASLAFPDLP